MWEVTEHTPSFGRAQAKNAKANRRLKSWYKATKEQYKIDGKVTWERVKATGGWPHFRCKAAATRKLTGFALSLAQEFNELLGRVHEILSGEQQCTSQDATTELVRISQLFMRLYSALAEEALSVPSVPGK